jgi:hypothetical protein
MNLAEPQVGTTSSLALLGRVLPVANEGRVRIQIAENTILEVDKDLIASEEELINTVNGNVITKIVLLPVDEQKLYFVPRESFLTSMTILPYRLIGDSNDPIQPLSVISRGEAIPSACSHGFLDRILPNGGNTDCSGTYYTYVFHPVMGPIISDEAPYHHLNDD